MKKILCFLFLYTAALFSQSDLIDLKSPENIKLFADHLFCTRDYHRAIYEYENYLRISSDDNVMFRLGLAYQKQGEYESAVSIFEKIFSFKYAKEEILNSLFQAEDYTRFRNEYLILADSSLHLSAKQLYLYSFFYTKENLPLVKEYETVFNNNKQVLSLYERKANPGYKSELTAAILSAVIPGAGKIYTEQYGDGITALITTGLLTFLSVDNFNANHKFRGWLFGGLAALFYAGNIYGSAASAQIYNAGLKLSFDNDLSFFLNEHNFFMPDYGFCK